MEDLIGSAAGGGLVGLLGTAFNRVVSIWERREIREDTRIQNAHELLLIAEQRETNAQETEAALVTMQTEGSYSGLTASLQHDGTLSNVSPWVNNIRALVRPSITGISLVGLSIMAATMAGDLQVTLIESFVFVSTTATVWWFGDRAPRNLPRT